MRPPGPPIAGSATEDRGQTGEQREGEEGAKGKGGRGGGEGEGMDGRGRQGINLPHDRLKTLAALGPASLQVSRSNAMGCHA